MAPRTKKTRITTETYQKFDAKTGPVQCYEQEKDIFLQVVKKCGYTSMSDFLRHAGREKAEREGFELPPLSSFVTITESTP